MVRQIIRLARIGSSRNKTTTGGKQFIELRLFDEKILQQTLENLEEDFLKEYARQVAHNIVDAAPVDTGELKGSIGVARDLSSLPESVPDKSGELTKQRIDDSIKSLNVDDNFVIGASADHAEYVEFGTTYQIGQPFLRQEIVNHSYNANLTARRIKPRRS